MEQMSQHELDTLRKLQAKKRRIQRNDEKFFIEVDNRKDEILKRWHMGPYASGQNHLAGDRGAGAEPRPIQRDVGPLHV